MLRVVIALVHTGSRLASGDCGTNNRVFVVPPIAGAASAVLAAPARKPRRYMVLFPPVVPDPGRSCAGAPAGPNFCGSRHQTDRRWAPERAGTEILCHRIRPTRGGLSRSRVSLFKPGGAAYCGVPSRLGQ